MTPTVRPWHAVLVQLLLQDRRPLDKMMMRRAVRGPTPETMLHRGPLLLYSKAVSALRCKHGQLGAPARVMRTKQQSGPGDVRVCANCSSCARRQALPYGGRQADILHTVQ